MMTPPPTVEGPSPEIDAPPPGPQSPRRLLKWLLLIAAMVAVLAAVRITGHPLWPHPPKSTQPSATASVVKVPGLAPLVGRWGRHEESLVIDSSGSGVLKYADLRLCQRCSSADAPTGTLTFELPSVSNGVASGSVTASSDPFYFVGEPVTARIAPGYQGKGVVLQMTFGGVGYLDFCNSTSVGQCGA